VIYVRVPDLEYGTFSEAFVLKGPVDFETFSSQLQNNPYTVPTDQNQQCSVCSDQTSLSSRAAWFDQCWHCSALDHLYVDFTIGDATLQHARVDYNVTTEVVSWTGLSGNPTSFELDGSALSYAFYTANLPSDQGINIQVEVTSGAIAIVQVMPKDCTERALPNAITTIECLLGVKCSIYTTDSDIGNFTGELRIVISGEDIKGTIAAYTDGELCAGMTADNAPFCSQVVSYSVLGDGSTFLDKDTYANYYYTTVLYPAFSSLTGCRLSKISDSCQNLLKQYSCQIAMQECSNGYGLLPQYDTCTSIENECGASFNDVGLPSMDCNHNFYTNGITWVGPGDDDTPVNNSPGESGPNLWLIFLIIPILVIIIIIVVIVRVLCSGKDPIMGSSGYQAAT